jgi:hypothetical protein
VQVQDKNIRHEDDLDIEKVTDTNFDTLILLLSEKSVCNFHSYLVDYIAVVLCHQVLQRRRQSADKIRQIVMRKHEHDAAMLRGRAQSISTISGTHAGKYLRSAKNPCTMWR